MNFKDTPNQIVISLKHWRMQVLKGKEPVIDIDDLSPRSKRTRSPTGIYDPDKFISYATFQAYESYFKKAPLLVKRVVD